MKALRQNLSRTLVKLHAETEKLQQEDEIMKDQEFKLRESYKQLEQTQSRYRAKGEEFMVLVRRWVGLKINGHKCNRF
jgi:hypothetical protein